jgi:hypothetical protein
VASAAATDQAGNASTALSSYQVVYNGIPPATPQYPSVSSGDGKVTLSWNANTETDFARYRIYGGTSANPTAVMDSIMNKNTTSSIMDSLVNYTQYFFHMSAVDTAGNESALTGEMDVIPFGLDNDFALQEGTVNFNDLTDSTITSGTSSFTYAFWIQLTSMPYQGERIFGNNNDALDFVWQSDATLHFMSYLPDYHNFDTGTINYTFTLGNWAHVAFTREYGDSIAVYINGTMLMSAEDSDAPADLDAPYLYCNDRVDELQIWNRALSAAEIQNIMNRAINPQQVSSLVGYWRFEEGSGTTAYDLSGNGNNGSISAAYTTNIHAFYPFADFLTVGTHTNVSPIPVTVNFTKEVTGLVADDFVVGNGTASGLTGSGITYGIDITPTSEGNVTLDLPAAMVQDDDGRDNVASATLTVIYDISPPTAAFSSTAYPLTKDNPVPFTVAFSEPVTGFELDDIALSHGEISTSAYSLSFNYMEGYASSDASSEDIFSEYGYSFSVEVWYKNTGVESGNNAGYDDSGTIITNYRRLDGGDQYNNFSLAMRSGAEDNSGKAAFFGTISNERLDDDQWHHIAGTFNADLNKVELYVDGVLNSTEYTDQDDFVSSFNKIYINNHAPFAGEHEFECSIAGVRITSGVRYESNFSPSFPLNAESNSIIALDFSTGNGATLNDLTDNGNNFTIFGSTWVLNAPSVISQISDSLYSFNVITAEDGQIAVSLSGNQVLDMATNGNTTTSAYSVVYNGVAPSPPQSLSGSGEDQQVTLSWSQNSEGDFQYYKIYSDTLADPLILIDSITAAGTTSYIDTGLTNYREYHYRLTAGDTVNNVSTYSDSIIVIPFSTVNTFSLGYDGSDDYVSVDNDKLSPDSALTVAFQFKTTESSSLQYMIGDENNSSGYSVHMRPDGTLWFQMRESGGFRQVKTTQAYDDTTWHHVAAVWNGGLMNLYVDGDTVSYSKQDSVTNFVQSTQNMIFGRRSTGPYFFQGNLDLVMIWHEALSLYSIQERMNAVFNPSAETNLTGYWRFDKGSGTTAIDLSGLGNHAAISGAAWTTDIPDQVPPAQPTTFAASAGDHQVTLNWAANSEDDLIGYKLYRALGSGSFTALTTTIADTLSFVDSTAMNDSLYYYYLKAVDVARNESIASDTVSAQPVDLAPAIPAGLIVSAGDGQVSFGWTANEEWDITSYNI